MRSRSLNKENWAEDIICSLRIPQGITSEGSWRCHWAVLMLERGINQSSRLGMRWQHRIPCLKAQDGKSWEATSSITQGRWLFLTVGRGSWRPRKSVLSTHGPCVSFSLLVWAGPFDFVLSFSIPWNTSPRSSSHPYCATVLLVLCLCRYIWWWLEKSLILSSACHEDLSLNSRTHAEKPRMVAFASNTSTGEVETGRSPINLIRQS